MKLRATIVNSLWSATNLPSYFQFRRALAHPQVVQAKLLCAQLERNRNTAFGLKHDFCSIRSYEQFIQRVPLTDYAGLEPWIDRLRRGESNVLTADPVTRLVPTSGSTGSRKLIPFTAGLQDQFNAALGPWLVDLLRQSPGLAGGPAYWSITPLACETDAEDSVLPIGFDTDTAYLGGTRQSLANAVMAVPEAVRFVKDLAALRYITLFYLLRHRELRLISVWHPSFLSLLLNALPANWENLLEDIRDGQCRHAEALPRERRAALKLPSLPRRERELRAADPSKPETIWPRLKLISCWGDGSAELAASNLKRVFPTVFVQPKGLLATEAFVTIPFAGARPVALRSHFFEFLDDEEMPHRVHELQLGQIYEVVVTTAGGLWRYRLGDRVQVTGYIDRTPSLVFLGRSGNVSDLFGEKLSEAFVTEALCEALGALQNKPDFILLAPDQNALGNSYTLYVEGKLPHSFADHLDQVLRQNPHYAYCQKLGQLLPLRRFAIAGRGYETFLEREAKSGMRLGSVKPVLFSSMSGWSEVFEGRYDPSAKNRAKLLV